MRDLTIGTTFTGGGCFEAGAVAAGLRPIFGVEHDPEIAGVYARNYGPHCIVSGVEDVDYSTLQTPWHHHTSPSCKKASVANKERGETAEDIAAARGIERAIRALNSPQFSLENVWGYREFESFRIICRALEESGYAFGYWHLNAADYGVPQTRKRLILLASKTHRPRRPAPTHSQAGPSAQVDLFGNEPLKKWEGWYRAIEDLIPTLPESKFAEWQLKRLPEFISESFYTIAQQSDDRKGTETGYGCPRRAMDEPALTVTNQTPSWFKAFLVESKNAGEWGDGLRGPNEPCTTITTDDRPSHRPKAFIVDGKPANYKGKLQITDGDSPVVTITASQTRHPFRAYLVGGANTSDTQAAEGVGVSSEEEPSRCVNASNSAHWRAWLQHGRVVSMTPRALARFQSIPDSYVLPDKAGLACRVIGNGVPSLLAQRICEAVLTMEQEKVA